MASAKLQVKFPGEEEAKAEAAETPNFAKMTKADLLAFVDEHDVPIEDAAKLKLGELRNKVAGLFGQHVPKTKTGKTEKKVTPGIEKGNTIHEVVAQIQKIKTQKEAINKLNAVQDEGNFALFRTGGILGKMKAKDWKGEADDFFEFVETELGMKKRKAQYAIGIYEKLVELDIPWNAANKLGWSKLRLIHAILDEDNVAEIMAKVLPLKNLFEVTNFVRDWKTKEGGKGINAKDGSTPITRLSFQVHEDQKETIQLALAKAKEEGNTEFDGPALEYVCLDYLASGAKPKPKRMTAAEAIAHAKKHTPKKHQQALCDSIIAAFTTAFPDAIEVE
jgi:hypothetical protein